LRTALPLSGDEPRIEIPLYDPSRLEEDLKTVGRNRLAEKITGGLSMTTKMPCPSWGISAARCRIGSVLAGVKGSTCESQTCYAKNGTYRFPNVQKKLEERYEGLFSPLWTPAMIFLVRYHCDRYLRLFDSGDVQDVNHMHNICTLARNVPDIRIWMPSREQEVVRACEGEIPENLTVRLSATMVDGPPPSWWPTTSTVVSVEEPGEGICPAPENEGQCGECRSCWDRSIANVAYRAH
jgi:hypothetical protein